MRFVVVALGLFGLGLGLVGAPVNLGQLTGPSPTTPLRASKHVGRERLYLDGTASSAKSGIKDALTPVRSLLNVKRRMRYGDYVWNDHNIPRGTVWIRVDLKSQLLSVFRAGNEIGTAVILYGATERETPIGVFPVLAKMSKHRSSIYDAEMPYTLRLTNDGISIHASDVRWGLATHGCIGVPFTFAEKMFDQVSRGDRVLIVSAQQST